MEGKVKITILSELGHEPMEVTPEEAERLITMNRGRYFVVNEETNELLQEFKLEPGLEGLQLEDKREAKVVDSKVVDHR